jgi:hypothetical protein
MLDQRTLNQIRRFVAKPLKQRCTLYQEQSTMDDLGYPTHGLVVVEANVPCRVIRAGRTFAPQGAVESDQEAMTETYRLVVPYDTRLAVDMVVEVEGLHYSIINIWTKQTDATDQQATIARKVSR